MHHMQFLKLARVRCLSLLNDHELLSINSNFQDRSAADEVLEKTTGLNTRLKRFVTIIQYPHSSPQESS